jgi:hypothetical protein
MKLMKDRIALLLFVFVLASCRDESHIQVIWQIGASDGRADEFALSPDDYQDFLKRDFGWEDRFYLIGRSTPGATGRLSCPALSVGGEERAKRPAGEPMC